MKRSTYLSALLVMVMIGFAAQVQAQRVSLTANFSSFNIESANSGSTTIDYAGSTTLGLNARFYTQNKWAWRAGVGVDNLQYSVGDGVQTNYSARRQDLRGVVGLEKHFMLGALDIYPGVFVPVVVVGEDDILDANYQNISNGNMRAGLGVLFGANLKFGKIFRLGLEFDATYDSFKAGVYESIDQASFIPIRGINPNMSFTFGIAL